MLIDGVGARPVWELNKFHLSSNSMKKTGRGVWMLGVVLAFGLLARPEAPPLAVLRLTPEGSSFYRAMGFATTANGHLELSGC